MDMGSFTCATILVRAVYTKARQARFYWRAQCVLCTTLIFLLRPLGLLLWKDGHGIFHVCNPLSARETDSDEYARVSTRNIIFSAEALALLRYRNLYPYVAVSTQRRNENATADSRVVDEGRPCASPLLTRDLQTTIINERDGSKKLLAATGDRGWCERRVTAERT